MLISWTGTWPLALMAWDYAWQLTLSWMERRTGFLIGVRILNTILFLFGLSVLQHPFHQSQNTQTQETVLFCLFTVQPIDNVFDSHMQRNFRPLSMMIKWGQSVSGLGFHCVRPFSNPNHDGIKADNFYRIWMWRVGASDAWWQNVVCGIIFVCCGILCRVSVLAWMCVLISSLAVSEKTSYLLSATFRHEREFRGSQPSLLGLFSSCMSDRHTIGTHVKGGVQPKFSLDHAV